MSTNAVFQFNEDGHQTIWRNRHDPCQDIDQIGFMDLFSSVFEQENNASSDGMMSHGAVGRRPRGGEEEDEEGLKIINNNYNKSYDQRLSMEEILMVAGEKFIQFSTNRIDGISMMFHPYGSAISGLCFDDERDVEIMHTLLSAAEKVGLKQFDAAARLVSRCQMMLSESGSPVQRLGVYFAAALEQKMRKECDVNLMMMFDYQKKKKKVDNDDHKGLALGTNNAFLAAHQKLPFGQIAQFAGVQAILEQVSGCRKVHLIDLQIRSGVQWTALMQGLADSDRRTLQRLRITAVGTADQAYMEETGKRLQSFAHTMNLPLSYKVVYLQGMDAFHEDLLSIESDETVAVYSMMMLRSMISKPESLDTVMKAVRRIRPVVMVVSEVEANHNSPSFIDRFTEALLFYSAYFDCLEECMERDNEYRGILEGRFFGEGIINIVAAEEEERVTRNVKVSVWRKYLSRFGMREMELSESSKYQARLVVEQFGSKGRCCNLEFDGKALIAAWKGTPIQSLTAWNFI